MFTYFQLISVIVLSNDKKKTPKIFGNSTWYMKNLLNVESHTTDTFCPRRHNKIKMLNVFGF